VRSTVLGTTLCMVLAAFVVPFLAGSAAATSVTTFGPSPTCASAGTTGLTAAVVAHSGQWIHGTINAKGCDIGIYVGPGITGVHITGATVKNANDHGIMVQDTSGVVIRGNIVEHNGLAPHVCGTPPCIAEDKAIQLVGTTGVIVQDNQVLNNMVDGGIGVADDGPIDPGALAPGMLMAGTGNVIIGNSIVNNWAGCGIVVAAYNSGAGVGANIVKDNGVVGNPPTKMEPFVGGIVVAADVPNSSVWENVVTGNRIYGSIIPGIVVHSNAPGDRVWNNTFASNKIANNGFEGPPNDPTLPTGIEVVAEAAPGMPNPPTLSNTTLWGNTVNTDAIGVWLCDETNTMIIDLGGHVAVSVQTC
jgi:hypothetical protein